MSRKQAIGQIRQLLVKRRDALRTMLAGDLVKLGDQTDGDEVDFAIDSAQDEINSQLAEAESRELTQIHAALEKIEQGDYGICDDCGRQIPITRLRALPYATLCINCQRAAEETGGSASRFGNWNRVEDADEDDLDLLEAEHEAA